MYLKIGVFDPAQACVCVEAEGDLVGVSAAVDGRGLDGLP